MKDSAIQWTDNTFNPWEGCTKVAPECKNCYAETMVDKRFGRAKWGKGQPRRRTSESLWKQPLAWNKFPAEVWCERCAKQWAPMTWPALARIQTCPDCGGLLLARKPRVFCLSLGDWLDEEVPIEWFMSLLTLTQTCKNLEWQLLTKRPQNWEARLTEVLDTETNHVTAPIIARNWLRGVYPENVWIGVSAGADQKAALSIPAKLHFLSCEPMLNSLVLHYPEPFKTTEKFDWIIFGGESGKDARPCNIDWIRQGLAFCRANNIAAFVKQLGKRPYFLSGDAKVSMRTNRHRDCVDVIADSHGGDMSEWPEDLRVRQFPNGSSVEPTVTKSDAASE